ncbi:WXG100 family type VII secretion target [Streptomyces mayteni]
MGDFEDYTHERLAAMLAGANPEQLTTRADVLLSMADVLNGADKQIFLRMSQVEWQGEGADAFRAWGRHLVEESASLAAYARKVGNALQGAGEALFKVRGAMPPVPERQVPLVGAALPTVGEELERQEAIRAIEVLTSSYRVAADDMAEAEEPRFRPITLPDRITDDSGGYFVTPAESGTGISHGAAAPGNEQGYRVRSDPAATVPQGRRWTEEVVPPGGVPEGLIGTSLDSTTPVAERVVPPVERQPASEGLGPGRGGSADLPDRVLLPGVAGLTPPHPRNAPRPQLPQTGRPPGNGSQIPVRSPQGTAPSEPWRSGNAGYLLPGAGEGREPGSVVGRAPVQGGPPLANGPSGRLQPPSGIIGGIPQPPPSAGRGLPASTAIGAQKPFAYRDPTTGLVRGPGGVPVVRHPEGANNGSRKSTEQPGRYSNGRTTQPKRRRRGLRADDEPGEAQKRIG